MRKKTTNKPANKTEEEMTEIKEIDHEKQTFVSGSIWLQYGDGTPTEFDPEQVYDALLSLYPDEKIFCEVHDKDIFTSEDGQEKDGKPKPPHMHFIVTGTHPFDTMNLRLCQSLGNVSRDLISLRKGVNYKNAIRYLLHRDNADKYQYDVLSDNTISNDYKTYKGLFTNRFKEFYEICKYMHFSLENLERAKTQRDALRLFGSDMCLQPKNKALLSMYYSSPSLQATIQEYETQIRNTGEMLTAIECAFNVLYEILPVDLKCHQSTRYLRRLFNAHESNK